MQYPILRLNPKADYRLKYGHVWIYSNEIDNKFYALKSIQPGALAIIENADGRRLGLAYINPNTLICGRLLSSDIDVVLDQKFFTDKIKNALALREQIFAEPFYRLVYGESDYLPGLVVDRFADVLVVQVATAGMENFIQTILAALDQVLNPAAIILKNDGKMREVEGLENRVEFCKGSVSEHINLQENGVQFKVPIKEGQKTGWFFDHRMARARMQAYVRDKTVLDVFSYVGGWGIQAAAAGASKVVCTDISATALAYVQENAALNNLHNVETITGDAFTVLQDLVAKGAKFDVVVLDPPAFIPRRKDLPKGTAAYLKANTLALQLLKPHGTLISGSCSMHLPAHELRTVIHKASIKANKTVQILEQGHQAPDHPIHPAIPETEYLKSFIVKVAG